MIADITTVNTNEFKTVMSQLYKFCTYSNKSTANSLLRPNSFVLSCESACMCTHTKSHTRIYMCVCAPQSVHTHTHTHTLFSTADGHPFSLMTAHQLLS